MGQSKEGSRFTSATCSLYGARHDLSTYVLQRAGNIAAARNSMGHSDVKTAMTYQHPELNVVRDAINSQHILRHAADTVN